MNIIFGLLILQVISKQAWVITDTHFDDLYVAGTAAKCFTVDCCHADSVPRNGQEDNLSGRCGHYDCYVPLSTISSGLDFIAKNGNDGDVVFWLMDAVPGDVLSQSIDQNKERVKVMANEIKKKLPNMRIFPTPGNHDYYLSSEWNYPPNCEWMLEHMADCFSDWLSTEAIETFKIGGYYTQLIESRLRIISLNFVFFDTFSIHSGKYPEKDPGDMVAWFKTTLKNAKAAGEKVIIISHEAVGLKNSGKNDLNPTFNQDYATLMEEYADIVITHLSGHSHDETFRVLPSLENPKFHMLLNPALTTWQNINPKLRKITYDLTKVTDWTTYMLDIAECNAASSGYNWKELYTASSAYGKSDFSTTGLKKLLEKLNNDSTMWTKWLKYYKDIDITCNAKCKKEMLCSMKSLTEEAFDQCTA